LRGVVVAGTLADPGKIAVAFGAAALTYGAGGGTGVGVISRVESQKILEPAPLRPHAAGDPLAAVAIDAAGSKPGVECGQDIRIIRREAVLIVGAFRLSVTRSAEGIVIFNLNSCRVYADCQ